MTQNNALIDESAVKFDTLSRMHVNLVVKDIERSLAFYKVLFGAEPTKVATGYAKFELADPPLNFSMNDCDCAPGGQGNVGHFGLQVKSDAAIETAQTRYQAAGYDMVREKTSECCHSVQSKVWLSDPDANLWEVFVVHADEHGEGCTTDCTCYAQPKPSVVAPTFDYSRFGLTPPEIKASRQQPAAVATTSCCGPTAKAVEKEQSCCAPSTGGSCC